MYASNDTIKGYHVALFRSRKLYLAGADELVMNYAGGRFQVMVTL